jgi:6-phosphofructokinase 2
MADVVTLTLGPALDCTTTTDRVRPTRKLRCEAPHYDAGGGGINVARLLHALGKDAVALFPAGGWTGKAFEDLVRSSGTSYRAIPISSATRQSFCVNERGTGLQFRFVLPGATLTGIEQQACVDALAAAARGAQFVILSGSLPTGVPLAMISRVADRVRATGARLIVDTSGDALRAALRTDAYLIKPDLEELEELAGRPLVIDADQVEAARELQSTSGATILLVSLAERGALIVTRDDAVRLPAFSVTPAGGSGAGDSMVAGLTCGLIEGLGIENAVRLGMAAGAAALMAPGTALAEPTLIRRLYSQGTAAVGGPAVAA